MRVGVLGWGVGFDHRASARLSTVLREAGAPVRGLHAPVLCVCVGGRVPCGLTFAPKGCT
eukprot:4061815-Prymnesium_polylepis.2